MKPTLRDAANLDTKILDFGGFDSRGILNIKGGIIMSAGNFPEMWSQQIVVVGIILAGRLGIRPISLLTLSLLTLLDTIFPESPLWT